MLWLACNDTPFVWFHVGLKRVQDKLNHHQNWFQVCWSQWLFVFGKEFEANRQYTLINTALTSFYPIPLNKVEVLNACKICKGCLSRNTQHCAEGGVGEGWVNLNCIFFPWNTKCPKRLQGSNFLLWTKENLRFIMCKGKILWKFETIKVYKDLYGNKSHSSMTVWQEILPSFEFSVAVATAAFQIHGWISTGYLLLLRPFSSS